MGRCSFRVASASLTLYMLVVLHTHRHNPLCHAALPNLTDPAKDGYGRLIRDIRSHPISLYRIPPLTSTPSPYGDTINRPAEMPRPDFENVSSTGGDAGQPQTTAHENYTEAEMGVPSISYGERSYNDGVGTGEEDGSAEVNVAIKLFPIDILSLDPTNQVLDMSCYMLFRWKDSGLMWDELDYGNMRNVYLSSDSVWTPSVSVVNGAKNSIIFHGTDFLFLSSSGEMSSLISTNLQTSCKLDLFLFPFDKQSCDILITSYREDYVKVIPIDDLSSNMLRQFSAGGEWTVSDVDSKFTYLSGKPAVRVTLNLQRKTTYYAVSLITPMVLFTIMDCLVFIIPPESGEKVSFLVSIFISNAVFSNFINSSMSRGLDEKIPLIMQYLVFMWVWSIISFLATVVVIRTYHNEQNGQGSRQETADTGCDRSPEKPSLKKTRKTTGLRGFYARLIAKVKRGNGRVRDRATTEPSICFQREQNDRAKDVPNEVMEMATPRARTDDGDGPEVEKSDLGITAKTLDKIFLILSLIAVFIVDIVVAAYFSSN